MDARYSMIVLSDYLSMQQNLWSALLRAYPGDVSGGLDGVPTNGSVDVAGKRWEFKRHGCGVLFIEADGKQKVDLHDGGSGVARLDSWRLATYLGGLGRQGQKILNRSAGVEPGTMDERTQAWLQRLADGGLLAVDGAGFVMRSPQ